MTLMGGELEANEVNFTVAEQGVRQTATTHTLTYCNYQKSKTDSISKAEGGVWVGRMSECIVALSRVEG